MNKQKFIKTRDEYVEYIKQQLMGPGSEGECPDFEHEILSTGAAGKYCLGIIYPQEDNYGNDDKDVDNSSFETTQEGSVLFEDNNELNIGKTSPQKDNVEAVVSDEVMDSTDTVNLAMQRKPSSFGFTFYTKENLSQLSLDIEFAIYEKNKIADCLIRLDDEDISKVNLDEGPFELDESKKFLRFKKTVTEEHLFELVNTFDNSQLKGKENIWRLRNKFYLLKEQFRVGEHRIPFSGKLLFKFDENKTKEFIEEKFKEKETISVKVLKHNFIVNGEMFNSFTLMLVNNSIAGKEGSVILLQPKMKIITDDEINTFRFVDYSKTISNTNLDEEEQNLNLLYRNKKTYATGLGTATYWEIDDEGKGFIESDFYPLKELPEMAFERDDNFSINRKVLSMKFLSILDTTSKTEKIQALYDVVNKYELWIKQIESDAANLENIYKIPAEKNIFLCKDSLRRMKEGIEILSNDDIKSRTIWTSFLLANKAMYMQREQLNIQKNDPNREFYWRPFQLAFLLLSIKSIVDDSSEKDDADRNLVDLIWFPTGGGKTEAYLGLTAMTIFYRRLAYPHESGGTTVIMRYTMRLLTTQQYLRAATLICACELIRFEENKKINGLKLGEDEITIGLWVGSEHTPNKLADANTKIAKLAKAKTDFDIENNFKFQVRKCPWCGRSLIPVWNKEKEKYEGGSGFISTSTANMSVSCTNENCDFNSSNWGALPIKMVDEDLYNNPPTLLFGTVDKFAMLAWKNESGKFFGIGTNNRAPELIIQDELHLISSSLGTIVGLYEAAIDKLCSLGKSKPKIIASTATIRRAVEQCRALYNRSVRQFPSPGIDSTDSYFSREGKIEHSNSKYGRLYVGMMSPKVKDMLETKAIANMLQASKALKMLDENGNEDEELKDAFWTLVVYFNTTRELGMCRSLVNDNVVSSIRSLSYINACDQRIIGHVYELTGQTKTGELVKSLDTIEKITYQDIKNSQYPANIVLATNMISVGIDIPRLNVMLIVGQPKLTSEYIQASSRVGRNNPGVSFVIYDSSKSRDRSHYEQFKPYHESFYKYVEPTGVTPFSEPARKRALPALVVTLLRNMLPNLLGDEKKAENLVDKDGDIPLIVQEKIDEIKAFLINREKAISELNGIESDEIKINHEIDKFIEKWKQMILKNRSSSVNYQPFSYGYSFITGQSGIPDNILLKAAGIYSSTAAQETLTSMRNVDETVSTDVLL